jgi:hypothetical protein
MRRAGVTHVVQGQPLKTQREQSAPAANWLKTNQNLAPAQAIGQAISDRAALARAAIAGPAFASAVLPVWRGAHHIAV